MKTYKEVLLSKREIKETYIIYALIKNDEIVYIGQSTNIMTRIGSHLHSEKVFDSWCIVENLGVYTTSKEVSRLEEKYIRRFLPKYNKAHNAKFQKAVSARNKLLSGQQEEKYIKTSMWKRSQLGIVLKGKAADDYR